MAAHNLTQTENAQNARQVSTLTAMNAHKSTLNAQNSISTQKSVRPATVDTLYWRAVVRFQK